MSLEGSQTFENLKAAFAGESQANRRYLYFAKVADIEGYPDIAGNVRDTAPAKRPTTTSPTGSRRWPRPRSHMPAASSRSSMEPADIVQAEPVEQDVPRTGRIPWGRPVRRVWPSVQACNQVCIQTSDPAQPGLT